MTDEVPVKTRKCWVCGKVFTPRFNLVTRAKVCTTAKHRCKKEVQSLPDGRRKIVSCVDKCCRSRYQKSASTSAMDQAIDPRKLLSSSEFSKVIDATRKLKNPHGIALRFIAATGCRLGESLLVRPEDVRPEGKISSVRIPTLKRGGRPVRTVDLYDAAFVTELKAWAKKVTLGEFLFQCPKRTLQYKLEKIFDKLQISKDSNVHVFRHTRASQLAATGAPLNYVRQQMGWSSVAMSQIYVHTNEEERLTFGKKLPRMK